jgi:predicted Zn-dependent peptidase
VTIVVVGDVSLAEVRPHLEKSFGSWRPGPAPALAAPPKARAFAPPSRLILVERPNAEQSDVRFTIRGPKFGGPDTASLEVARTVLGGMFTSRLTRRIREQLGYAYTIRASWPARRAASPITVGAGFFTPKTADAIKEVLAIVGGMSAKPIPEEELRRGQQYLIRGFPQEFETNAGVAGSLANLVLLGLPDDYYERYLADLAKVTPKDVQRVAKTYFPVAKLTLVIVGDLGKAMPGVRKLKLGRETKVEQEANPVK